MACRRVSKRKELRSDMESEREVKGIQDQGCGRETFMSGQETDGQTLSNLPRCPESKA